MKMASLISGQAARVALALIICLSFSGAQAPRRQRPLIPGGVKSALDRISAESLKGHLSFISSDLLEGRNTPSPGLDIAASYIAAQFRRAGLEPVGDDGYYQTASWFLLERDVKGFNLLFHDSGRVTSVDINRVSLPNSGPVELAQAALFKVDYKDPARLNALQPSETEGKVVITEVPDFRSETGPRRTEMIQAQTLFMNKMSELKPALLISVDRKNATGAGPGAGRLIDPENRTAPAPAPRANVITVHDPEVVRLHDSMSPGPSTATVSARIGGLVEKSVKLRNVVGLLRGSDPVLRDTYVLVTAHYDHIGVRSFGEGDRINNGANDDGSGTVSVIEVASALATLKQRPRRRDRKSVV